jgi:hypothetical protein
MSKYLITAVALAMAASPAAAVTLDAGVSGNITVSSLYPVAGSTFTMSGGFSSYNEDGLPDISGDLPAYSFTVTGTSAGFDVPTLTTTYVNVTGSITAYGQLIQAFAPTTLTVRFRDATGTVGDVFGRLYSTGPQSPAGYPGPVDLSAANGASFSGVYTRTNATTGAGT